MLGENEYGRPACKVIARMLVAFILIILLDFLRLNWRELWAGTVNFFTYQGVIDLAGAIIFFLLGSVGFFLVDQDVSECYRRALMYKWRMTDLFVVKSSIAFGSKVYMEGVINSHKVYGVLFKADDGLIILNTVSGGTYVLSRGLSGLDIVVNRPENEIRFYNAKVMQIMKEHKFIFIDDKYGELTPVRVLKSAK